MSFHADPRTAVEQRVHDQVIPHLVAVADNDDLNDATLTITSTRRESSLDTVHSTSLVNAGVTNRTNGYEHQLEIQASLSEFRSPLATVHWFQYPAGQHCHLNNIHVLIAQQNGIGTRLRTAVIDGVNEVLETTWTSKPISEAGIALATSCGWERIDVDPLTYYHAPPDDIPVLIG